MNKKPIAQQDLRRRRALFVFQIIIYSYLLGLFLFQLWMYHNRDW